MKSFQVLASPIKSVGDKKEYRLIKLENNIKALLISTAKNEEASLSDPTAAITLSVRVGSYDEKIEGLAHFLEHLLFRGSEKFPRDDEMHDFASNNGGFSNAWTSDETTEFFVSVVEDKFLEAVDRLADMIISPLMLPSSMNQERELVDSEFHQYVKQSFYHKEQVLKLFLNQNHPASKFNVGNLVTLKENVSDDELHGELIELLKKYTANKMGICVQSNRSLDDLQGIVVEKFSEIKNDDHEEDPTLSEISWHQIPTEDFYSKLIFVKPTDNETSLTLTWIFPPTKIFYKCKPLAYLGLILGNTEDGGIINYLKDLKLINHLNFDHVQRSCHTHAQLSVDLTDKGYEQIDFVLEAILSYLKMMKNTPMEEHARLYTDFSDHFELSFKYFKESSATCNVQVSCEINLVDDDDLLRQNLLLKFDEEIIKTFIDRLSNDDFNITIMTSKHENYAMCEKYFKAKYDVHDMPENFLRIKNERKKNEIFYIEKPNPFKPTNFDIFESNEHVSHPALILQDEIYEVWHKLDKKYEQPEAYIKVNLTPQNYRLTVAETAYMRAFEYMIGYHYSKKLAQPDKVGLNAGMFVDEKFMTFSFNGYNDKMLSVVDLALKEFKVAINEMNEEKFHYHMKEYKKSLHNNSLNPDYFGNDELCRILRNCYHTGYELVTLIDELSFEGLKEVSGELFKKLSIQILAQGNITRDQAVKIVDIFKDNFQCEAVEESETFQHQGCELPSGLSTLRLQSLRPNDDNTQIENFYQVGPETLEVISLSTILCKFLDGKAFEHLRTKNQLGYVVSLNFTNIQKVVGISLIVVSQEKKHKFIDVYLKMDEFINEIAVSALDNMTEKDLENVTNAIIKDLMAPDLTLASEVAQNYDEISKYSYDFDKKQKIAELTKNVNKLKLQEFYRQIFNKQEMRQLSVQIIGNVDDETEYESTEKIADYKIFTEKLSIDEHLIQDPVEFRNSLNLYPQSLTAKII